MSDSDSTHLNNLRHSAAHLLAAAVLELWPNAQLTLGPAIPDGFYYDFDFSKVTLSERGESKGDRISEKDLPKIAKKMQRLRQTWREFTHREVTPEEARELYKDNQYKLELINEIAERNEPITLYTAGAFTDLCRGGHVEAPAKELQHIKLLSIAGAYWRGNEENPMLTRIYGTAFTSKEDLEAHLALLEEAKKRDHRKLGKHLDLFTFSDLVGAGLPLFTPRGTIIREALSDFLWEIQTKHGYQKVDIPHLAKPALYHTSGHWDKFGDNLFHVTGRGGEEFVVKPMNCPHHTQLYASRPRSYRDLPVRYAEITKVYRDEQAGELLGLARVRSITQDDAHVFCTLEQVETEIGVVMDIIQQFYAPFGFELKIRLSLSDPATPDAYLGTRAVWEAAESNLRDALKGRNMAFVEETGEAAFYGPKIDFTAIDSLKRAWQLATVQLDFNMPERFKLTYTDTTSSAQTPVMIHRAITGAQERFMAILLEHYAGHLPLWLSPTQVTILPISDDQVAYAQSIAEQLRGAALRVEVNTRAESIGKKIREAELMKVPVMLVVGHKEAESNTVAVRTHVDKDRGSMPLAQLQQELVEQVATRQ